MNDRLVWIDCEMTGLDLGADALIEVAALVTDFDLNVLGDGVDLIVKPPAEALDQMNDFVREMHEKSGLLDELDHGITLAEAEEQVLAYIKRALPRAAAARRWPATRSPPTGRSWPATCRRWSRSCTTGSSTSPRSRSCPGAGSPARTSRRRPSAATTGRSPTSRRASRSCATTARPSSSPPPGPDSDTARAIAARHGGSLTGLGRPGGRGTTPDADRFRESSDPYTLPRSRSRPGSAMVGIAQLVERRVVVARCRGFKSRYSPQT